MTAAEIVQALMLLAAFVMQFMVLILNCGAL